MTGHLERCIDLAEDAEGRAAPAGNPPRAVGEAHGLAENPGIAPSVAGHVARVRVDRDTGAVEVLEDHLVQDVGRVLNPALVAGQQLEFGPALGEVDGQRQAARGGEGGGGAEQRGADAVGGVRAEAGPAGRRGRRSARRRRRRSPQPAS